VFVIEGVHVDHVSDRTETLSDAAGPKSPYADDVTSDPAFRLFGFPVRIRRGFLLFMLLVVALNGTSFGLWLALSLAVFTLLHELGHAFAARATGARAEISLDFMAGYAAFVPTRTLTGLERAGISFAGPAIQIAIGTVMFFVVNGGFSWPTSDEHLQWAVLWSGPVIGLLNLIPILPFDGGNILEQLISFFAPQRARPIMIGITLTVVAGGIVYAIANPALRPFIVFMLVPLLTVVQMSNARRSANDLGQSQQALSRAEARAWATGEVIGFPPGTAPSPWFRAYQQLSQGNPDVARHILVDDLATTRNAPHLHWYPPDAAPLEALHSLLFLLHDPLPSPTSDSSPLSHLALADVLLRLGVHERAGHLAADAYRELREPAMALQVARAAAALGDHPTAMAWLRATAAMLPTPIFTSAVQTAREFDGLRATAEFAELTRR